MTIEDGYPTLRFLATLKFPNTVVENVRCRLVLPRKVMDKPVAHLSPTPEQYKTISGLQFWRFSLKGDTKSYDGQVTAHIEADPVHADQLKSDGLSEDLSETIFRAEPALLHITTAMAHGPEQAQGNFWLTPNPLLRPATAIMHSYTGAVEVKTARELKFSPYEGLTLTFSDHYKRYKNADGDDVSFPELVARFELSIAGLDDTQATSKALDAVSDIALLSSIAARRVTVCLGWEAYDSKSWVRHYLRNRTLPGGDTRDEEELIDISTFNKFLEVGYEALTHYSDTEALRRLLHFALAKNKTTVDSNFVTLYTALEMLVLHFRKDNDLQTIVPKNNFRRVRRKMEALIDDSEEITEEVFKEEMKRKLSELNRISFASAFDSFCDNFSVDLSDLWPVVDSSEGVSLMKIRNLLVHGEHFGPKHYSGMVVAREHLKWILERMILRVLGWQVDDSRVSRGYLRFMTAYKDWRRSREAFQ